MCPSRRWGPGWKLSSWAAHLAGERTQQAQEGAGGRCGQGNTRDMTWAVHLRLILTTVSPKDFPSGPVTETPCFQSRNPGSTGQGTRAPHATTTSWHAATDQKIPRAEPEGVPGSEGKETGSRRSHRVHRHLKTKNRLSGVLGTGLRCRQGLPPDGSHPPLKAISTLMPLCLLVS